MDHSTALRLRAISVVILFAGFYLLALAIVAGLLGALWVATVATGHVYIKLTLVVLVVCGIILYSIFPRVDRFETPGPRLDETSQPRLFERIRAVARATGQEAPREVYLLPDVNAFVMNRGGFLGIGSRRVMGIGLPLMQVVTEAQFAAVIAHEFGHYVGGDTRLGPWIHKTRMAMARTIDNLHERNEIVSSIFLAYGNFFMRRTQLISRAQEFAADALAARVAGRGAIVTALKTIEGASHLYGGYWSDYVQEPVMSGVRPRILEGFSRFTASPAAKDAMTRVVSEALEHGETDAYDSHPSLGERVRAVESLTLESAARVEAGEAPAVGLLDRIDDLEIALLASIGVADAGELETVDWNDYGEKVLARKWTMMRDANRDALRGVTPASIHEDIRDGERARRIRQPNGKPVEDEYVWMAWRAALEAGFALALRRAGWELNTDPGRGSILFHHGDYHIDPGQIVGAAGHSGFPDRDWRRTTEEAGIAGFDFGGEDN